MKTVLALSSLVVGFVIFKVHNNKKLQNELYMSLIEMNNRLEECMKERTPDLVNDLPQSRSPSPSPVKTDCSSRGSFTLITSEDNLSQYST